MNQIHTYLAHRNEGGGANATDILGVGVQTRLQLSLILSLPNLAWVVQLSIVMNSTDLEIC